MAKRAWREQRGGGAAVRIEAALALLLITGRASAEGPPPPRPAPIAAPQEDRTKRAIALHDEARELHAQGRYRAAIAKLETALTLDPDGKELVYNLALIHERLGEVDAASLYYRRYLAMETAPKEREKIQAVLRRLEGARPDLGASQDGQGRPTAARSAASSRVIGPWVVATGIVGATGIVTGAILGVSALARSPGADAMTGPNLSADELVADARAAHRQAVGADVALLVGLVATGAAVVLYTTSRAAPSPSPKPPAARVDLALGPLAGALRVSF